MREAKLREELARYGRRLWQLGWVANHDGNLSCRLPRGRLLCTPTGVSKADLSAERMLVLDGSGKVLSGKRRPFSEINLHLAYYQARPDVEAVIHSHAPTATGFGVAGVSLDRPMLPEAVVSLGVDVPTVPRAMPGSGAAVGLAPYLEDHDALLLAGNGVLTGGGDVEQAFLRMELVEHLCKIALVARQLGNVDPLPSPWIGPLLDARCRAGLGPEARGRARADECPAVRDAKQAPLEALVRREIERVLKSR